MTVVKLDQKDRKILYQLDKDARQPFTHLAKRVRLSREVVNYRVQKLIKEGIIKKFITVLNTAKLGYLSFRVYIRYQNVSPEKEKEITDYFLSHPNIFWFATLTGRWDLEVLIFARNFFHYTDIFSKIMKKFGNNIGSHSLSIATYSYHFKHAFLTGKREDAPVPFYGGEPEEQELDKADLKILSLLSQDARMPSTEIASKIKLSSNAVKNRIKALIQKGVIQTFRLWLDISKLGYVLYKSLVSAHELDNKRVKQIITYCSTIPNMLYFIKTNGQWDFELEAEAKNIEEFRNIMLNFRHHFSSIIKDHETLVTYKEHKINYFPMSIREVWKKGNGPKS